VAIRASLGPEVHAEMRSWRRIPYAPPGRAVTWTPATPPGFRPRSPGGALTTGAPSPGRTHPVGLTTGRRRAARCRPRSAGSAASRPSPRRPLPSSPGPSRCSRWPWAPNPSRVHVQAYHRASAPERPQNGGVYDLHILLLQARCGQDSSVPLHGSYALVVFSHLILGTAVTRGAPGVKTVRRGDIPRLTSRVVPAFLLQALCHEIGERQDIAVKYE